MSLNFFSYSLSNNKLELSPRQFSKSLYYTIHFGNNEKGFREKLTRAYPSSITTARDKKLFLQEFLLTLDKRRVRTNLLARKRRQAATTRTRKKVSVPKKESEEEILIPDVLVEEKITLPSKNLKAWALKKYFPTQYALMKSGVDLKEKFQIKSVILKNNFVYIKAVKDFSGHKSNRTESSIALKVYQSYIFLNKEINVTIAKGELQDAERNEILKASTPLINQIRNIKGIEKYIFKLFNNHYDSHGDLLLRDAQLYSMGWSLARSDELESNFDLEKHMERSLQEFYEDNNKSAKTYLSSKFLSQITTNGVLLEKLVEIIDK